MSNKYFTYTPHIYGEGDWQKHIAIFILIQVVPLILAKLFGYSIESVTTSLPYIILTGANIFVILLAIYENKSKL